MSKLYDNKYNAVGFDLDGNFAVFSTQAGAVFVDITAYDKARLFFSCGGKVYEKERWNWNWKSLPSVCGKWAKAIVEEVEWNKMHDRNRRDGFA